MCLTYVDEIYEKPLYNLTVQGYKYFFKLDDSLLFPIYHCDSLKLNDWNIDNKNIRIKSANDVIYPTGFHIYKNLEAISKLSHRVVFKVKFNDIVAVGYNKGSYPQDNDILYKCYVAKKFKIIEKVEM